METGKWVLEKIIKESILNHAVSSAGDRDFGHEVVISLSSGGSIRLPKDAVTCEYIRVVTPEGYEAAYWDKQEWIDDYKVVASIMGCAYIVATKGALVDKIINQELKEWSNL